VWGIISKIRPFRPTKTIGKRKEKNNNIYYTTVTSDPTHLSILVKDEK